MLCDTYTCLQVRIHVVCVVFVVVLHLQGIWGTLKYVQSACSMRSSSLTPIISLTLHVSLYSFKSKSQQSSIFFNYYDFLVIWHLITQAASIRREHRKNVVTLDSIWIPVVIENVGKRLWTHKLSPFIPTRLLKIHVSLARMNTLLSERIFILHTNKDIYIYLYITYYGRWNIPSFSIPSLMWFCWLSKWSWKCDCLARLEIGLESRLNIMKRETMIPN